MTFQRVVHHPMRYFSCLILYLIEVKRKGIVPCKQSIVFLEMTSPRAKLLRDLEILCNEHGVTWDDQLSNDIPRKWRVHGDMLLLPSGRCFLDARWTTHLRKLSV